MWSCCADRSRVAPSPQSQPITMATDSSPSPAHKVRSHELPRTLVPTSTPSTAKYTPIPSDYKFYMSIGVGCYGLASVLLARHNPSHSFVVVRQVELDALSEDQLEEVQQEMKLSQLLYHPNIVGYHCSFVSGYKLWAVQLLTHYGSCADIMHSSKAFSNGFRENIIALILRDIVQGLRYLHSLSYVHRSIRSKHFLIHESGVVKLSGLRSLVSMVDGGARKKALHGHFSGTGDNICFLAPELLAQDLSGYSYKSDVYSIGIAALELATGEAPFAGLPLTEIMMLKLRGHPPMLLHRQDSDDPMQNFSKTFFKVVDMCVDPNPIHRPNTTKLLSLSFLKIRKKSSSLPNLKELLLPVVPLDPSQLKPDPQLASHQLEKNMSNLDISADPWEM